MPERTDKKAPFSKSPHEGGKTASMPNSTSHSSGGAPSQIMAGVRKGRTGTYEAPKAGRGRGSQA